MSSKVKILTIDGGGIRGIFPAVILDYIETEYQRKMRKKHKNRKSYHIGDIFDFVAGTSTGGILACLYLLPNSRRRPKFSSSEVLDFYMKEGDKIFSSSVFQKIWRLGGLSDEKYDADSLEEVLQKNFKDTKLSQLLKPCLIPAYDIEKRQAVLFTSHNAKAKRKDFYVKDVARATSAAPTFFEPASITSLSDTTYHLIDGGLYANNPTLCAYSEVKKLDFAKLLKRDDKPTNPNAEDMIIVSIGTGAIKEPYKYSSMKDAGSISWIKPIIDILMSSNSETNAYHVRKIFKEIEQKNKYFDSDCYKQFFRIETELFIANPSMDDASTKNLKALRQEGLRYIDENKQQLDYILDLLVEDV